MRKRLASWRWHVASVSWYANAASRTVETFAQGLEQDGDAVRAALTTPWSNAHSTRSYRDKR
ncbi:hypothetical protein HUW63_32330 [Myxococcus sp. AM001]|nr:hypothetical protein [Myxococcus sp. AM001]